jgi:type IV fimbrial biogenesis protein FimT
MTTPLQTTSCAQRGVTLVETLICLAVTSVTLGALAPNFGAVRDRRHLEGVAAQLETDIHFARSLAAAHDSTVRISFSNDAAGSGWVIHRGAASLCRAQPVGEPACNGAARILRHVHIGSDLPVQLQANVNSIVFDPLHGTSTPTGTLRVLGRRGGAIHQVVNLMGRVRSCAPAPGLAGYANC